MDPTIFYEQPGDFPPETAGADPCDHLDARDEYDAQGDTDAPVIFPEELENRRRRFHEGSLFWKTWQIWICGESYLVRVHDVGQVEGFDFGAWRGRVTDRGVPNLERVLGAFVYQGNLFVFTHAHQSLAVLPREDFGRVKAQLLQTVRAMHGMVPARVHGALMPDCLGLDRTGDLVVRGEGLQLQAQRKFLPPLGHEMTPEGDNYSVGMLIYYLGHGSTPWLSTYDTRWMEFRRDAMWLRPHFRGTDADFAEMVRLLRGVIA